MKLALCGSNGKMGSTFIEYFNTAYDIVKITHTGACLNDIVESIDLVVDFTNGTGAFVHGVIALTHNIPIIIGSTGLSLNQKETLQKIADNRKIACLICNNFSYGMVWLKKSITSLHLGFPNVHIEEAHHKSKLDAPSGTALTLATLLDINREDIHAIRDDSYDVRHTILLENDYETIKIEHVVKNRYAYMQMIGDCIDTIQQFQGYEEWL